MPKAKTRLLKGLLELVSSSRVQYKPYTYNLSFIGNGVTPDIWVELEVPMDTVVEETDTSITLNLDGLKAILRQTADAVDELDADYKKTIQTKVQNRY